MATPCGRKIESTVAFCDLSLLSPNNGTQCGRHCTYRYLGNKNGLLRVHNFGCNFAGSCKTISGREVYQSPVDGGAGRTFQTTTGSTLQQTCHSFGLLSANRECALHPSSDIRCWVFQQWVVIQTPNASVLVKAWSYPCFYSCSFLHTPLIICQNF